MSASKRVLVVGPHPDDQELGMGGTIALLARDGHDVLVLDMTDGEPTPFGDPETRAREAARAAEFLSIGPTPVRRLQLGLRNRFVAHTIEARHAVAGVMRAHRPDIVFLPYFEDAHPDHIAVTRIVEDARFDAKLTGVAMPGDGGAPPFHPPRMIYYFCTHLRLVPQPSFIVDISGVLDVRSRAVAAYASQFEKNPKNRGVPAMVEQQARYFGSRIGAEAGEPFYVREPIGLSGFGGLI